MMIPVKWINSMNDRSKAKPVRPNFLYREEFWLGAALIFAALLLSIVLFGIVYIFYYNISERSAARSIDIIYKLGLLGVAVVTFCTVVWRGLVSTRQVAAQVKATKYQARQIRVLREQNRRGERNDLAALFQKGSELLASEDTTQRAAGLATLHAVAVENRSFAQQSLNIITDYLQTVAAENFSAVDTKNTISVIRDINEKTSLVSEYSVKLNAEDKNTRWSLISGVESVTYTSGYFKFTTEDTEKLGSQAFLFRDTEIEGGEHKLNSRRYRSCRFYNSRFSVYAPNPNDQNVFEDCDFSDCIIPPRLATNPGRSNDRINGRNNYYYSGRPPKTRSGEPVNQAWLDQNFRVLDPKIDRHL